MPEDRLRVNFSEMLSNKALTLLRNENKDSADAVFEISRLTGTPPLILDRPTADELLSLITSATDFHTNQWLVVPRFQRYLAVAQLVTMLNSYR